VEGIKRFDYAIPADKAFAVGGYRVYSNERTEFHQTEEEDGDNN